MHHSCELCPCQMMFRLRDVFSSVIFHTKNNPRWQTWHLNFGVLFFYQFSSAKCSGFRHCLCAIAAGYRRPFAPLSERVGFNFVLVFDRKKLWSLFTSFMTRQSWLARTSPLGKFLQGSGSPSNGYTCLLMSSSTDVVYEGMRLWGSYYEMQYFCKMKCLKLIQQTTNKHLWITFCECILLIKWFTKEIEIFF